MGATTPNWIAQHELTDGCRSLVCGSYLRPASRSASALLVGVSARGKSNFSGAHPTMATDPGGDRQVRTALLTRNSVQKVRQDASQSLNERLPVEVVSVPCLNTRKGVVWGLGSYGMKDVLIISCKVFWLSSMYDYTRGGGGGQRHGLLHLRRFRFGLEVPSWQ
ncbi:hypothetical protein R1flu_025424 [Riccia fluitans]|uniref:Uncharacterized protein n=1 Tax=Riccia fluitans TaxID=41844 RepID=A0ABD1XXQ0_9MARC